MFRGTSRTTAVATTTKEFSGRFSFWSRIRGKNIVHSTSSRSDCFENQAVGFSWRDQGWRWFGQSLVAGSAQAVRHRLPGRGMCQPACQFLTWPLRRRTPEAKDQPPKKINESLQAGADRCRPSTDDVGETCSSDGESALQTGICKRMQHQTPAPEARRC